MEANEFTLTCKMGSFVFGRHTIMSHAKLIRDSVMGQFFAPKPGLPRLKSVEDIHAFVLNDLSATVASIPFAVVINPS